MLDAALIDFGTWTTPATQILIRVFGDGPRPFFLFWPKPGRGRDGKFSETFIG